MSPWAHHGDELDGLVVAQVEESPAANGHDALCGGHAVVGHQHLRRVRVAASASRRVARCSGARCVRARREAQISARSGFQGFRVASSQRGVPCGSGACRRASARTSPAGPPRRSPRWRTQGRRWLRGRRGCGATGSAPLTKRPTRRTRGAAAQRAPPAGRSWSAAQRRHRGEARLRGEAELASAAREMIKPTVQGPSAPSSGRRRSPRRAGGVASPRRAGERARPRRRGPGGRVASRPRSCLRHRPAGIGGGPGGAAARAAAKTRHGVRRGRAGSARGRRRKRASHDSPEAVLLARRTPLHAGARAGTPTPRPGRTPAMPADGTEE